MRLALKHQIILAPAPVLCLMTLLLFFLQLTYWDMSVKRQQAKDLKTAFIAMVEADMAEPLANLGKLLGEGLSKLQAIRNETE